MKPLLLICFSFTLCARATAGVLGDTFRMDWDFPTLGTHAFETTLVAGPSGHWSSGGVSLDINDGTITVNNGGQGWSGGLFNGFVLTDLSKVPYFQSLTEISATGNVPPITPAVTFDADNLYINFTPTGTANVAALPGGSIYTFAFTVPEPSTGILFVLGSLSICQLKRKRN